VLPTNWNQMIADAMADKVEVVSAHTYRGKKWDTYSKPVVLGCDDGSDYVVKGSQAGKAIVNEQVVGRLGHLIGAPIPAIKIVNVPAELIAGNSAEISHVRPGLAHGSALQNNCTDKEGLGRTDVPENEKRFAALAVLYGWTHAGDRQLIYCLDKPQLVWSVDHGHFFPGGPNWSVPSLQGVGAASVFPELAAVCEPESIEEVISVLSTVKLEDIAAAVAAPPDTWAVTIEERKELAILLENRRTNLLTWKPTR